MDEITLADKEAILIEAICELSRESTWLGASDWIWAELRADSCVGLNDET